MVSAGVGYCKATSSFFTTLTGQREEFLGAEGKFGAGQQKFIGQQIEQAKAGQAASEEDVERFRGFATGATKAPELDVQRRQAADLKRQTKEIETPKGRFESLQKLVGQQAPTYSSGQRQLDQLLLAGDRPSRLQSIRDIREATRGVGEQVGRLGEDIAAGRATRQQEAVSQLGAARQVEQQARAAREPSKETRPRRGYRHLGRRRGGCRQGAERGGADLCSGSADQHRAAGVLPVAAQLIATLTVL